MKDFSYTGQELDVFASAVNWKKYFTKNLTYALRGDVLEVGAGIGSNIPYFIHDDIQSWTCLEPDAQLCTRIQYQVNHGHLPPIVKSINGTTSDVPDGRKFDTILYIDVLEHIEDDNTELHRAKALLNPGGHLIILVPAFQSLYTAFDKEIGHYRRYNKPRLLQAIPDGMKKTSLLYLDSMGYFASLSNKLIFKNASASQATVRFWDSFLVPLSKLSDCLLVHTFGKSLLGIWKKT